MPESKETKKFTIKKRPQNPGFQYAEEDVRRYEAFLANYENPADGIMDYHAIYGMIVNHPARRAILKALAEGEKTPEEILERSGISEEELRHHIPFLGFCIESYEKDGRQYIKLTKEGEVVKYIP